MRTAPTSPRFAQLMQRSKRDWAASRSIVGILRASSQVSRELERTLADVDLTLPQFNVLMALAASPRASLPLFEVTAELISSPPNVTWLSNRMEQRGLVRKQRDDNDRRIVHLELTERGWEVLSRAAPLVFTTERLLLSRFDARQVGEMADLVTRLIDR